MKNIRFILLSTLFIAFLASCTKSTTEVEPEVDPTADLLKIGEGNFSSTTVEIFSDGEIEVGYQRLFVRLKQGGEKVVTRARVEIFPLMDMETMKHSAPYENPEAIVSENGLFEGAVVFIMSGKWMVTFTLQNLENGDSGKVTLTLDVAASQRVKKVTGSDSATYFVTLVEPRAPRVGMNDFEITVHKKESMMAYPAVTDVETTITPTMPSMGHGSPNNEHPVHQGRGHYRGKVNFTMSGAWRVDLQIQRGGQPLCEVAFDIQVP